VSVESKAQQETVLPPPWQGEIDTGEAFIAATAELRLVDPALLVRVAQAALRQARARHDEAGAAHALLRLANAQQALGDPAAWQTYDEVYLLAERVSDERVRARVLMVRCGSMIEQGQYADGLVIGQLGMELTLAQGWNDLLLGYLNNTAICLRGVGEYPLALELLARRRRLLPDSGPLAVEERCVNDNNEATVWLDWAGWLETTGPGEARHQALQAARRLAEGALQAHLGQPLETTTVALLDTAVNALLALGEVETARGWLDRVLMAGAGTAPSGTPAWMSLQLSTIAVELEEAQRPTKALLDRLHALRAIDDPNLQGGEIGQSLRKLMFRAHRASGDFATALREYQAWCEHELRSRSNDARERARMVERAHHAFQTEATQFLAHDLRGSLSTVLRHLDDLAAQTLEPPVRALVSSLAKSAQQAMTMAEQAMDIMQAEFMAPDALAELDLSALLDDLCELMAPVRGASGGLLRDLQSDLRIRGEAGLLMRALGNLVRNALEHSPAGLPVRVIALRAQGEVLVSVVDQGPGLSVAARRQIFQRYASSAKPRGRGLGLAQVSRVCRLHHAVVEVQNPPGGGTAITLRFRAA
jgi:signal transduction histidine kinase